MPYIKKERRPKLDIKIGALITQLINIGNGTVVDGDLNYAISRICWAVCHMKHATRGSGVSYSQINKVIGALECAKLELYRRIAAPYEDEKIDENGDIKKE